MRRSILTLDTDDIKIRAKEMGIILDNPKLGRIFAAIIENIKN